MSTEANKAILQRYVSVVWNGGDLNEVPAYIAPDFVRHDPGLPTPVCGVTGMAQLIGMYRAAFPDIRLSPIVMLAEEDRVAAHWRMVGTHKGDLMGIAATGKPLDITVTEIFRFAGGKMVEQWISVDNLGMLRQLALVP